MANEVNVHTKSKHDRELRSVILIIGLIFTLPLIIIDFTYSNLGGMFTAADWGIAAIWVLLHIAIIAGWYLVIKYIGDPNKVVIRAFLIVMHILAIGVTMGHRAGWLENKQVIIDSRGK
jgi:hypothetical protein